MVDRPSLYVLRTPQKISSVSVLSPLCSRKLSWQACRRRTIECGRRASVSAIRRIGGAWNDEPVVAFHSHVCPYSTFCNRKVLIYCLGQLSFQQAHLQPQTHTRAIIDFHLVPLGARSGALKTPRYLDAKVSVRADGPAQVHQLVHLFVYLAGCIDGERHLPAASLFCRHIISVLISEIVSPNAEHAVTITINLPPF